MLFGSLCARLYKGGKEEPLQFCDVINVHFMRDIQAISACLCFSWNVALNRIVICHGRLPLPLMDSHVLFVSRNRVLYCTQPAKYLIFGLHSRLFQTFLLRSYHSFLFRQRIKHYPLQQFYQYPYSCSFRTARLPISLINLTRRRQQQSLPMKQSTPPRSSLPPKDFLDDSASMTSSTITSREKFFRKTDEKSATRRSISRNSRERQVETLDISRFYMKMGSRTEEKPVSPPRKSIINRVEETDRNKKRSPTPLPGHHKKKEKPNETLEDLEADLVVCDLQKKLSCQQEEKGVLGKRVMILEREIKVKLVRIQELQKNLADSLQRQTTVSKKLQEFQVIMTTNENSLSQARSSLQKLKNTIKQNKYMQIQSDNIKLKQENNTLKQEIQIMTNEAQSMNESLQALTGEVAILRKTNEHLANSQRIQEKRREIQVLQRVILTSKTEKERTLEESVERCTREKAELRLKFQKLELRLNFMQRQRNQELDAVKQAKNQIIIKLRNKLSSIFAQNHVLRAQNDDLRLKGKPIKASLPMPHRKNNLMEDSEEHFRLELSP